MKILIKESQLVVILEQITGLDDFMGKIIEKHPYLQYWESTIKDSIINSGCKKIGFVNTKLQVAGLSVSEGVLINSAILNRSTSELLYTIFHEIAHQYQYKKYGAEKLYECYTGEISVEEGAKIMQKLELVADRFSIGKLLELKNKGCLVAHVPHKGVYNNIPLIYFIKFIEDMKVQMEKDNIRTPKEISDYYYNWVGEIKNEVHV